MKTIGLIGGMSYESTLEYYRIINREIRRSRKDLSSAKILLSSLDFAEISSLCFLGAWQEIERIIVTEALKLQQAGADAIALCTNTIHKIGPALEKALEVPLIHIVDSCVHSLKQAETNRTLVLGTKFTMTESFFKARLLEHKIKAIEPDINDIKLINDTIYNELAQGRFSGRNRNRFVEIINKYCNAETQINSVILACTEIPILLKDVEFSNQLTVIDSMQEHCSSIVKFIDLN